MRPAAALALAARCWLASSLHVGQPGDAAALLPYAGKTLNPGLGTNWVAAARVVPAACQGAWFRLCYVPVHVVMCVLVGDGCRMFLLSEVLKRGQKKPSSAAWSSGG